MGKELFTELRTIPRGTSRISYVWELSKWLCPLENWTYNLELRGEVWTGDTNLGIT